jgi:hypothetical protein
VALRVHAFVTSNAHVTKSAARTERCTAAPTNAVNCVWYLMTHSLSETTERTVTYDRSVMKRAGVTRPTEDWHPSRFHRNSAQAEHSVCQLQTKNNW